MAARSASQTQPAFGVATVEDCERRCQSDSSCVGFNWVRDGRDVNRNCFMYNLAIGNINSLTLYDLYVKETCQPSMLITLPAGARRFTGRSSGDNLGC